MGKEALSELKHQDVSPEVGYFLLRLAERPEHWIRVSRDYDKLTKPGKTLFTNLLRSKMVPHLDNIKNSPAIQSLADQHRKANQTEMAGGTCDFSLRGEKREELLSFLRSNEIITEDFYLNAFSTEMVG